MRGRLLCGEQQKLEEELVQTRTRGRNLSRLRQLTPPERAVWEQRERAAQARLQDHETEHGCQR